MKRSITAILLAVLILTATVLSACGSSATSSQNETVAAASTLTEINNDNWNIYFEDEIKEIPEITFADDGTLEQSSMFHYCLKLRDEYAGRYDVFNFDAELNATVSYTVVVCDIEKDGDSYKLGDDVEDRGEAGKECLLTNYLPNGEFDMSQYWLQITYSDEKTAAKDGSPAAVTRFTDMKIVDISGNIALT